MNRSLFIALAFSCTTVTTAPPRRPHNKPATAAAIVISPATRNNAPTKLHVLFEYSLADALYGAITKEKEEHYANQITKDFLKGLAKMVVMKTFIDIRHYKTAAAVHVLMQNTTLVRDAINDKNARKNLAHHMIVRTGLPILFWYARALHNSKETKWVF